MKSLPIIFLAITLQLHVLAQSGSMNSYLQIGNRFNKQGADLDGSPYLSTEWAAGKIIFKNNYKVDNAALRYDAYNECLEVDIKSVEYMAKFSDLKEFTYEDPATKKSLRFKYLALEEGSSMLQLIFDGKIIFGIHNKVKRGRGSGSGADGLNPIKDKLTLTKTYYLIKEGKAIKVVRTKKSILNALPDQKKVLESYIDENKLDVKEDEDIIKLFTYYDSLQK